MSVRRSARLRELPVGTSCHPDRKPAALDQAETKASRHCRRDGRREAISPARRGSCRCRCADDARLPCVTCHLAFLPFEPE